jgi:hypothetical protein
MIRLVQEFGAQAGRQVTFEKERVRLGRAPDNDVVFDANIDLDASGRHCEFLFVDGQWLVVDVASRNGTYVNGVRVQRQQLKQKDVVECGRGGPRVRVEFDEAETPKVPAPTPGGITALGPPPPVAQPFAAAPGATPSPFVAAPQSPFAASVAAAPSPAFGAPQGTVAIAHVPGVPAPEAPAAPPPAASVGHAIASSLPAHAQVGKRTVALMIDQALAAQARRNGSGLGLKIAVLTLTIVVVLGLVLGGWYVWERENDRDRGDSAQADPSTVGTRIAAANEGNIYLMALRSSDGRTRGFCTAFAVNESVLATNAHCVRVATTEIARGAQLLCLRNKGGGEAIVAQPAYLDARFQNTTASRGGSGYDVGLVTVATRLPSWVTLAPDASLFALREGDAVFVYGFPGMTMNERSPVGTITLGLLNRVTDFFDNVATPPTAWKLQHSAQTAGGSSGSPIFHPSGVVIGVNAGSLSDDERQVVIDPTNGQRREVEVNRGSNFKYGMRADLIRQAMASIQTRIP